VSTPANATTLQTAQSCVLVVAIVIAPVWSEATIVRNSATRDRGVAVELNTCCAIATHVAPVLVAVIVWVAAAARDLWTASKMSWFAGSVTDAVA
jgi:hypothetical protein